MRDPRAGPHLRALRLPDHRARRGDSRRHLLLRELRPAPGCHRGGGPRARPRPQLKPPDARRRVEARRAGESGHPAAPRAMIRIGLSGWRYKGWRGGRFYPAGLPQRSELAWAAERYRAIELNGSFYSLQRPDSFGRWYAETPAGFLFAVKGPRFITHMLKLRRARTPLANFLASGLLRLEEKLGPILWQFPEALPY